MARLLKEGPVLWAVLTEGGDPSDEEADRILALLQVAQEIDALADVVVAWAQDRTGPMPVDAVSRTATEVSRRLDDLGVEREERGGPPPGTRGPRRRKTTSSG